MTTIVTRAGKGSPLTNTEVDSNFTNLNTAKIETLTSTDTSVTITGTGSSRDLSVPVNPNVVSGPASATANAIPRFNSTTGKLVQNSVVTVSDTGVMTGASINGASNTLSNIGNSALTNSTITINGNSTALGGSVSVGTVTSVTGTAPIVSSGGATPAISLANTAVTAGSYTATNLTVDAQGRITAASNGSAGATITDDTATNATRYPLYAAATSGTASTVYTSSTKYTYNPSTGTLSSTVMSASSDERLKNNWRPVVTNFVSQLANVKSGIFDRTDFSTTDVGVGAQSLQPLLPQAVITGEDGYLSVNYGGAALVAAIELAKVVEELRAKIAVLKAKVGE